MSETHNWLIKVWFNVVIKTYLSSRFGCRFCFLDAVWAAPFNALLLHLLAHSFCDVDAFAVEPVLASVTAYHEAIVVGLFANAP